MNVLVGVASRQGPQQNPLMKRLLESIQTRRPGVNMAVQMEVGEQYTRGEKRQRIFTLAKTHNVRYCVILEDDTEILEDDWLVKLLQPMQLGDILGMVNPLESKDGMVPAAPQLKGQLLEVRQCYGYCLHGDTLIHTLSGDRPIRDLVGRRPWVFSWQGGALRLAQAKRVWRSRANVPCVRVAYEWYAGGRRHENSIICTDDHPFMLLDESYLRAGQLRAGDRLAPFSQKVNCPGHGKPRASVKIGVAHDAWQMRAHWAWEQMHGLRPTGTAVHHLDDDSLNDEPDNLQLLAGGRHASQHTQRWHEALTPQARAIRGRKIARSLLRSWTQERNVERSERMKARWAARDPKLVEHLATLAASPKRLDGIKAYWAARRAQEQNHKIVSVEPWGIADVYDMTVPGYHNFAANNVFVHNCILYDLDWGPRYDPRITWLDDLAMSLQCRAAGRRVVMAGVTMVRHSKEPFLRDDQPPWAQGDRSRWGAESTYYSKDAFDLERKAEARLLVEQYGEMARLSLPPELL